MSSPITFRRSPRVLVLISAAVIFVIFWLNKSAGQSSSHVSSHGPELNVGLDQAFVTWTGSPPPTTVPVHAQGWTVWDNVYLANGTWFLVTDDPSSVPKLRNMISTGLPNEADNMAEREPTDREIQVISSAKAASLFGNKASRVSGTSFVFNDPKQFIDHYYHFVGELFLSIWRTYSTLDQNIDARGRSTLAMPSRMMFTHAGYDDWNDYTQINSYVLRSVFPAMSFEFDLDFLDRAVTQKLFVFDRVVIGDRSACSRGGENFVRWRVTRGPARLPASKHWWAPVRRAVLEFAGHDPDAIDAETRPVITYISRQNTPHRNLRASHHEELVAALQELENKYGWEVNIAYMEQYSREEQIKLAARTTVMIGIHGNGLTHQIWMNSANPKATVLEFFFKGGFTEDYMSTAEIMGLNYYAVWEDKALNGPEWPKVDFPPGFHEKDITLNAKLVSDLIVKSLL